MTGEEILTMAKKAAAVQLASGELHEIQLIRAYLTGVQAGNKILHASVLGNLELKKMAM